MNPEDDLSDFPTISVRFKLPGLPCKYNTVNGELLRCSTNVRCPKGFFDVGNQMCQPISDIKVNGMISAQDSKNIAQTIDAPEITITDMFVIIFVTVIVGALLIFVVKLMLNFVSTRLKKDII